MEGFEADHPDVSVDIRVTPWDQYWTKLRAAAGGGATPDVFWMNGPNFQLYAGNDIVAPLGDHVADGDIEVDDYPESLVDLYTPDGELYGVPKDFDTIGLWYNKKLFDDAGVDYPDKSWTGDDLRSAAEKLTDKKAGTFGITAALEGQQDYYNTILRAGGHVISEDGSSSGYDDPATIEGLRFWTDLIDAGLSPTLQQMTDTLPLQWFESGKTAMFYGGSRNLAEFKSNEYTVDKVDVAPLPVGEERAVVIHGLANMMSAQTEHPEEAREFLQYLGSEDAARVLGESGTVIPAYDGTQQARVEAAPEYDPGVFLDAVDYASPLPVSADTAAWNEAEAKYLTKARSGEMQVEEAAQQLADDMDAVLADEKN
ncbi:ABC transporter substrate-binding protein [Nocardioides sp. B-3]|uniref:ABC transporter substrate-binding protein n=1 Tax=Nocardioides sp. B-3 TaxID=2895565 RepID=UPI002202B8CB|nr:sugar ABC transporter substrate-binding protein [Nocardioides sp. B-3]